MAIRVVRDVSGLSYNRDVFGDAAGIPAAGQSDRFTRWWAWAERHGLNQPEYLMPQLHVATSIEPFSFEQRFVRDRLPEPTQDQIARLAPWDYQIEMGSVATKGERHPADWAYHRYRRSLLIDTIAAIAGADAPSLSVLDVACHCGVFSLELAEKGFGDVTGLDLRSANIERAHFLADVFGLGSVRFGMMNARDLRTVAPADIVLCAGLLYHVTFPMELLRSLFGLTRNFLMLDSVCHNYALSGFHLVCGKDVAYSAEGEAHYELHPTYRALCDALYAVGFNTVFEVLGDQRHDVANYATGNVRTFVAAKDDGGPLGRFLAGIEA